MHLLKKYLQTVFSWFNRFIPDRPIQNSKKKWNKLAQENARFYVVSKQGTGIDEKSFKETGAENYQKYIIEDKILDKVRPFSDKRILNIGCGLGRLEEFFAKDFKEVYGIDISEIMVDSATKRLKGVPNVHFIATDGVSYPFADGYFDFVFSYIVFQHMPTREVVEKNFKEIFRVLKPGMIAKIQIRSGHQPYKWQWFYGPAYGESEARLMLEKIGFKIVKTEGAGTKRFFVWLRK